jgi:hypothetical protein
LERSAQQVLQVRIRNSGWNVEFLGDRFAEFFTYLNPSASTDALMLSEPNGRDQIMWSLRAFDFTSPKSSLGNAQRPMRGIFWLTIPAACCTSLLAVVADATLRHEQLKKPEDFVSLLMGAGQMQPESAAMHAPVRGGGLTHAALLIEP